MASKASTLGSLVGIVWLMSHGLAQAADTVTIGSLSLPRATIAVDGTTADWAGIAPLIADALESAISGAQLPASQDITAVYVAADDAYVYWRIDLAGAYQTSTTDKDAGPSITFDNGQTATDGTAARIEARVWEWAAPDDPGNFGVVFKWYGASEVPADQRPGGYGRIFGNSAEMRIPRGAFADVDVRRVYAHYYIGNSQTSDTTLSDDNNGGTPPGDFPFDYTAVTSVSEVFSNAGAAASC